MSRDVSRPTLEYGRSAKSTHPYRFAIAFLVIVTISLTLVASRTVWPWARDWHAARREATTNARMASSSIEWYAKAAAWREPADRVKFFTPDVNADPRHSGTTRLHGMGLGGDLQGIVFDNPGPRAWMTEDAGGLFTHERMDRFGVTQLICIGHTSVVEDSLWVYVTRMDRLPDGRAMRVLVEVDAIDLRPLGDTGDLRIYAGQPDPIDASRFTIPFESHGRPGVIDGIFESAAIVSKYPGVMSKPGQMPTGVRLTLRIGATTRPNP